MSNLAKYGTTIDEHVKTARQILGIGGDAIVDTPSVVDESQKIAAQASASVTEMSDEELIPKIAEAEGGKAMLIAWDAYGRHLGAVKFAEESKDPDLLKQAESNLYGFLVEVFGEDGAVKVAEMHTTGNALDAFLPA